jgi:hypothetical protein
VFVISFPPDNLVAATQRVFPFDSILVTLDTGFNAIVERHWDFRLVVRLPSFVCAAMVAHAGDGGRQRDDSTEENSGSEK